MASADGRWNCTVDSPMGRQDFVLNVATAGATFSGTLEGALGRLDIADGALADDTLTWSMPVPKPFPMTLDCTATVAGDTLDGKVKAGFLGSFALAGTRAA